MAGRVETGDGHGYAQYDAAEKSKYVNAALQQGISQSNIDSFLSWNPEDYHRLSTALQPEGAAAGMPPAATPAGAGAGSGTPDSLAGLNTVVTPPPAGAASSSSMLGGLDAGSGASEGSSPGGAFGSAPPDLRALSRRTFAQDSPPLAALQRKAY